MRPVRSLAPLLVPIFFTAAACGPSPAAVTPAPAPATAPLAAPPGPATPPPGAAIEPDSTAFGRIDSDIRYLASPALAGRGTGEPGARLAAEHIRSRFEQLGLRPTGDALSAVGGAAAPPPPGDAEGRQSYFQRFQARVGARIGTPVLAFGKSKGKPPATPAVTADGSADGTASGPLVFVGHGITAPAAAWDDYGGKDVEGKIAVILDGPPRASKTEEKLAALHDFGSTRYKIRTAREHKAAAVVLVSDRADLPPDPLDPSSMGLPAVVITRATAAQKIPGLDFKSDTLWDAKKPLPPRDLPKLTLQLTTHVEALTTDAWNLLGALPARAGSAHAGEWIVVGAHYDHLGMGGPHSRAPGKREPHLGADDNASGTALMLEVAHRLAHLPQRPLRNVLFAAFGAEEIGLVGSRWLVDHPTVPLAAVAAMINADMVGRLRDRQLLVDGTGTAAGWSDLVTRAADGLRLRLTFGAEGYGASDHASFTAAKIPIAFLFTGVHDDYHLPSDTADKINVDGISSISVLAARLASSVADRDTRLAFVEPAGDPHRSVRGGFKVALGTLPDYAYQGKGLRLTGVRPDSPAARAGLTAADVIVKLDKHEITNIHDYMFALGELEAGRETSVELDRAGKRVVLKIVPAPGQGGSVPAAKPTLPPNHP